MGRSLRIVEDVEVDDDDVGWGSFLRMKVLPYLHKRENSYFEWYKALDSIIV